MSTPPPAERAPITIVNPWAPFSPITFFADQKTTTDIWFNDESKTSLLRPEQPVSFVRTATANSGVSTTLSLILAWQASTAVVSLSYLVGQVTQGPTSILLPSATTSGVVMSTDPSLSEQPFDTTIITSSPQPPASSGAGPTLTAASSSQSGIGSGLPSGSSSDSKNGLSGGAVAGVAIGCLLAGALLAGIVAFFFLKKNRQTGMRDSEASSTTLIHREKGPAVKTMSLESGSPIAGALENRLPLPLEDKAISGEISKISNLIKNHVQSYYHTGRVSPVLIDYDDLQALGDDMPVSVGTLSTLLGNSATREIALRFCIAWIVVSRMQLRSPPSTTFLPPEISQCFLAMNIGDHMPKVHATYFSRWRAITAELMQSVYVRNPFSATDVRLHNLQLAANLLNNVLRPYSDSRMDDGHRSRNLEEILKRSALFAFTLFSQPSTWEFDWDNGQDVKSGSLCIFPALVQVKDENGETVKPPRPFNEAVIRRLDG